MQHARLKIVIDTISHCLPHLPSILEDKKQALLFSALTTLLYGLKDSVTRIEKLLLEFSSEDSQYNFTRRNAAEAARLGNHILIAAYNRELDGYIPRATLEIWSILDATHRFFLIIKELSIEFQNEQSVYYMDSVKLIRNTFQHLNERLGEYYQQPLVGDSIFGDFTWRFRDSKDSLEKLFMCKSGITLGINSVEGINNIRSQASEYPTIGVYDLNINYVKQIPGSKKDGKYSYEKVALSVSEVISVVNLTTMTTDFIMRTILGEQIGKGLLTASEVLYYYDGRNGVLPMITELPLINE